MKCSFPVKSKNIQAEIRMHGLDLGFQHAKTDLSWTNQTDTILSSI